MRQKTVPSLVQMMACRLFGTRLFPKTVLTYYQLNRQGQASVEIESNFSFKKIDPKISPAKWRPFLFGRNVSTRIQYMIALMPLKYPFEMPWNLPQCDMHILICNKPQQTKTNHSKAWPCIYFLRDFVLYTGIWDWVSNFIPHCILGVITYPLELIHVSKTSPHTSYLHLN